MVQSPPCKSKYKYLTSVDLICSHPSLTSAPMSEVLLRVVQEVFRAAPQYHQQHLLQTARPTHKLPEDKLASFKYLPPPPAPNSSPSVVHTTVTHSEGVAYTGTKRCWSEDSYTDSAPPTKKQTPTASVPSQEQLYPQFFDQVFHNLSHSCVTSKEAVSHTNTSYISSNSSSGGSSSSSSVPSLWKSTHSDVTTSSLSDDSHLWLDNISFDSMDSIESLNEAINLLNGY